MRKRLLVLSVFLVGLGTIAVEAYGSDNLLFPTSESEIVEALSLKDGQVEYMGVMYESKSGKVYKVIDNKRFQLRGLRVIADSPLIPKVGALIHFDTDSIEIRKDSYTLLDEFGKALKGGLIKAKIVITGHTDNVGSKEYNQKLSEKRARAVKIYLLNQHEIEVDRIDIRGYGESKPIASNSTEDGRLKNRRVEFVRIE